MAGRREIMELGSPVAGLPKGRGVLMGGGTFSCMPPSMIAGRAMLRYLEEREEEIYPALEEKGGRLREGVEAAFRSQGIPAKCLGVGSLFSVCFPGPDEDRIRNIEDIETRTDLSRRSEFNLRMLNRGVYLVQGKGAVSMAHTDEDISRIVEAAGMVAKEMAAGIK